MSKVKKVCKNCGSDDLIFNADAVWDVDQQTFVLDDVEDDSFYCRGCDSTDYGYKDEVIP